MSKKLIGLIIILILLTVILLINITYSVVKYGNENKTSDADSEEDDKNLNEYKNQMDYDSDYNSFVKNSYSDYNGNKLMMKRNQPSGNERSLKNLTISCL